MRRLSWHGFRREVGRYTIQTIDIEFLENSHDEDFSSIYVRYNFAVGHERTFLEEDWHERILRRITDNVIN